MRTIAVLNQKGGVGKTTTVANTAAALADMGAKVMAIDFDPQAHLTIHLGIEPQDILAGSYRVLTQSARLESEIMMVRPNLWLLPANINLVGAESELVSVVGREIILREALEECHQDFDYCLIDCAPSLGLLTLNALAAAEEVLIPLQPHFLALQGFGKLLQTVDLVNKRINPNLKVNGILLCMFDSRASLPNEVKADIERFLSEARGGNSAWAQAKILPTYIRRNIKLAEAPSYGQTIFEYESNCNGAEDYQKVAQFIHAQTTDSDQPQQTEELQSQQQEQEQPQQSEEPSEYYVQQSDENIEYYTPQDITEQTDYQEQYNDQQQEITEPQIESDYETDTSQYSDVTTDNQQQSSYQQPQEIIQEHQPDYSQGYQENTETLETQPESESSFEEPRNEAPAEEAMQEQTDYSENNDTRYQNEFQNEQSFENEQHDLQEQQSQEQQQTQPSDMNNEYSQDSYSKPPIEIKEIMPSNHHESDQHSQVNESSPEPDQQNDNPEHREY